MESFSLRMIANKVVLLNRVNQATRVNARTEWAAHRMVSQSSFVNESHAKGLVEIAARLIRPVTELIARSQNRRNAVQ